MKIALVAAAAATLAFSVPAAAQVAIDVGPGGVRAGVGHPHYHHRHRGYDSRAQYRRGNDVVVIKKKRHWDRGYHYGHRPNRTVIIER